eukprot:2213007-Pleurochrysis_carterae.AAC.1
MCAVGSFAPRSCACLLCVGTAASLHGLRREASAVAVCPSPLTTAPPVRPLVSRSHIPCLCLQRWCVPLVSGTPANAQRRSLRYSPLPPVSYTHLRAHETDSYL